MAGLFARLAPLLRRLQRYPRKTQLYRALLLPARLADEVRDGGGGAVHRGVENTRTPNNAAARGCMRR